jgi:hypothetical protein
VDRNIAPCYEFYEQLAYKFVRGTKYYSSDQIKEEETDGACGMCGGDKNAYRVIDQGVDGRIILKRILKDWGRKGVDWINLSQDWDKWRAVKM